MQMVWYWGCVDTKTEISPRICYHDDDGNISVKIVSRLLLGNVYHNGGPDVLINSSI